MTLEEFRAFYEREQALQPQISFDGENALNRIFVIAQKDSGQSYILAGFLLGLYDGARFKFDMTRFRSLDTDIFDDCVAVLKMDSRPQIEVHKYFENGQEKFENLARDKEIVGADWPFKA